MEKEINAKKQVEVKPALGGDFFTERPKYNPGYYENTNTVVRLCANRASKKEKKAYKITGIQDVASKNNWKGWLYLAPALILVVIFLLYPLVNTFAIAFMKDFRYDTGTSSGFTFDNFGIIFGLVASSGGGYEYYFTQYAIPNTFIIVFITVPLSTLIALLISVWLNSIKWFQKSLQIVFFLPYVTNTIAVGMVFSVLFADNGVINYMLMNWFPGLNQWLINILYGGDYASSFVTWIYGASHNAGMIPLCFYIIWSSLPFKILIFLSGLQGIDKQYYQAAKIDAASRSKILWKITVPLMSPQILYIVVTSFIGAFKEYTAVVGLFNGPGTSGTSGDPNMYTIVYYIYNTINGKSGMLHASWAAAAAVFLFAIILVFTALQMWVSKKKVHY
jgi:multiple sugar transport system permease protein